MQVLLALGCSDTAGSRAGDAVSGASADQSPASPPALLVLGTRPLTVSGSRGAPALGLAALRVFSLPALRPQSSGVPWQGSGWGCTGDFTESFFPLLLPRCSSCPARLAARSGTLPAAVVRTRRLRRGRHGPAVTALDPVPAAGASSWPAREGLRPPALRGCAPEGRVPARLLARGPHRPAGTGAAGTGGGLGRAAGCVVSAWLVMSFVVRRCWV